MFYRFDFIAETDIIE